MSKELSKESNKIETNKSLSNNQKTSKFWKSKPLMKESDIFCRTSRLSDLNEKILYKGNNNNFLPDKLTWNTIEYKDKESLAVVSNFLNLYYKENNNINFTTELLQLILGGDGFVLSIVTKNSNALCGVVCVNIRKMIVYDKNQNFAFTNFLCSHPKYRKKGLMETISNELIRYLNVEKNIQQGIFFSKNKISQPFVSLRKYYRPLNYNRLVDLEFLKIEGKNDVIHNKFSMCNSQISPNYISMEKNHLNKVYELLNKYKSQFNISFYYTKNELENILLNNNIVKSYVILDESKEEIIDFISYYKIQYKGKNNGLVNAGYIFLYSLLKEYGESMLNNLIKIMNNDNIDIIYSYDDKNTMNILLSEKYNSNEDSDIETYDKVYEYKFIKKEKKYGYLFNWEVPILTPEKTFFDFIL